MKTTVARDFDRDLEEVELWSGGHRGGEVGEREGVLRT